MIRDAFEIEDRKAAQRVAGELGLARDNQILLLDLLLICP